MVEGRHQLSPAPAGAGRPPGSHRREPIRTCIGCRRRATQPELIRIVRLSDGTLAVGRRLPGRGAWLCRQRPDCIALALKRRAFGRALRAPVASAEAERLAAGFDKVSPITGA